MPTQHEFTPDPTEQRGLFRRTLVRGGEAVITLAIVLLFFIGFVGIIGFSIPQGGSLRDLMLQPQLATRPAAASGLDLNLAADPSLVEPFVAKLSNVRRTVKNKRSGAITWRSAESGMFLEDRHSVQTYSRSGAEIAFGDGNLVELGESSLIVIRRLVQDQRTYRKRASLLLLDGLLQGRTSELGDASMPMELLTPGGSSLVLPEGAAGSDFRITVNADRSSTFTLHDGVAEVVSGGHTALLKPNQALTVIGSRPPGVPQSLPAAPSLVSPGHGATLAYRSAPPQVHFRWEPQAGADGYRFEIGRDRDFEDVVHEDRLDRAEFVHGNLGEGRYFWRVAALSGWVEGTATPAQELKLIRDAEPPPLSVAFPASLVLADRVLLEGSTEPGAEVFVGGTSVPAVASGEFTYEVNLEHGVNVVVVEAVDAAGNITYRSKLVNARF